MGLEIKQDISEWPDASRFTLDEKTGIYNPFRNTTGYGTPNPQITAFTNVSLFVTKPDQVTLEPAGTPVIIDVTSNFPQINGTKYEVLASALGYGDDKLPDGEYDIVVKYTLGASPQLYQFHKKEIFFAQVHCGITQLIAEVEVECCGPETQKMKDRNDGVRKLQGLVASINCGKTNRALELLKELKLICQRNPCKSC